MVILRSQWNFQVETPKRQLENLVCGSGERFGNLKAVRMEFDPFGLEEKKDEDNILQNNDI